MDFQVGIPHVENERLLLGLNQLFIRIAGRNVLVDTGLGNKWKLSETGFCDFQQPRSLLKKLLDIGVSQDDIDIVILSHLHYDHSGGGTCYVSGSELAPIFTNSIYYVQRAELEFAKVTANVSQDDYKPEDWEPLEQANQLEILEGECEILPGLKVFPAPGHSPGHQVVLVSDDVRSVFFPGDLISTTEQLDWRMITKYDNDPAKMVRHRRKWLKRAVEGNWICVFCHNIREPVKVLMADSG